MNAQKCIVRDGSIAVLTLNAFLKPPSVTASPTAAITPMRTKRLVWFPNRNRLEIVVKLIMRVDYIIFVRFVR